MLLLLLVVVSFVLYLSQGSSVFDLMSDGGREKKEFFGYDWNNPDQRRFLNVTTRAAGSVGVLISPTQEAVEKADGSYIEGLQQQMQAAFRANPDEIDQDAMQRMFQYMQAWPNFPEILRCVKLPDQVLMIPIFWTTLSKLESFLVGRPITGTFLTVVLIIPALIDSL